MDFRILWYISCKHYEMAGEALCQWEVSMSLPVITHYRLCFLLCPFMKPSKSAVNIKIGLHKHPAVRNSVHLQLADSDRLRSGTEDKSTFHQQGCTTLSVVHNINRNTMRLFAKHGNIDNSLKKAFVCPKCVYVVQHEWYLHKYRDFPWCNVH